MADVDDADALLGQVAHDLEQLLDLAVGDRGGGLVHDQYAAVEGDGLDDLHHLLLGDGQVVHLGGGIDAQVKPIQHLLGIADHGPVVHAEGAHGFAAQEDVFGHGHVRHLHQLLVDNGNAVVPGGIDVVDRHRLSVDEDLALLGDVDAAQHLDQRGLARAVLPQKRVDLAGQQLEVHALQRLDAGKRLADVFHFEQIVAH